MHMIIARKQATGFTMVEVLVAALLFTISLIGFAGAMAVSLRSTNVANVRSQATFAAKMLEERMRSNPTGVINGNYVGSYVGAPTVPTALCTADCSPAQIATHDTQTFTQLIGSTIPNGQATVGCNLAPAPASALTRTPPWGLCTISITWGEQAEAGFAGGTTGSRIGRFDWVFNP